MAKRKNVSTHTPSEERVGYSRMVVVGNRAYVSGTTSVDEKGKIVGKTVEEQANFIFEKVGKVLTKNGFSPKDVVRMRAFLVDMDQLPGFDNSFKKHYGQIHPACTLVGTNNLVDPGLLIEIEFDVDKG